MKQLSEEELNEVAKEANKEQKALVDRVNLQQTIASRLKEFDETVGNLLAYPLIEDSDSRDDAAQKGYDVACEKARDFISESMRIAGERAVEDNIGRLRQWLNEDRITDVNKMVTNEQLKRWLGKELLNENSESLASEEKL